VGAHLGIFKGTDFDLYPSRPGEIRMPTVRSIGLISDTHGLLRPEAVRALEGSELIIHAGDVGDPKILDELRRLAPLVAVRGNIDTGACAELPETAVAQAGSALIYVLHDLKALDLKPGTAGFAMVVSGHSHKPSRADRDGVIYVNPGSAGLRRFNLPITLARVDVAANPWCVDFIDLARSQT
jgi:putative phosphoesterase